MWNQDRVGSEDRFRWLETSNLPTGLDVISTPGHTPHHISIRVAASPPVIISGDAVLARSYGANVRTMPLIRYRSTDITRFLTEPCTCVLKSARRIAKIRGRSDEMVNCGMGNLSPWFFEQLLEDIPSVTRDWQVGVIRAGNHDLIEFRLELQNGASPETVSQAIKDRVARRIPDSWRNYQLGLFEFDFRFSEPGTLRTARKLRRLVDERTRSWE